MWLQSMCELYCGQIPEASNWMKRKMTNYVGCDPDEEALGRAQARMEDKVCYPPLAAVWPGCGLALLRCVDAWALPIVFCVCCSVPATDRWFGARPWEQGGIGGGTTHFVCVDPSEPGLASLLSSDVPFDFVTCLNGGLSEAFIHVETARVRCLSWMFRGGRL